MVSVDAGQSEPSYFDSVWAEFAAFSESFTLPAELPSESWFSFSWWDPWASDEETSSTSTAAKETAASDALCAAKRSRSPPGSPRSGRKRNLRVRSSASCSPAMMSNSTLCRAKMGETTSQLPHINESNAMPSPFARKTTRRRSASQRPASTTGSVSRATCHVPPPSPSSARLLKLHTDPIRNSSRSLIPRGLTTNHTRPARYLFKGRRRPHSRSGAVIIVQQPPGDGRLTELNA
mmetsp:Transcript_89596/g.255917  ORF Transcript_89596/g.255917 Transcript_89596/m.255917 type:complete len:235 (-) Transcript_89596:1027-1731(-)